MKTTGELLAHLRDVLRPNGIMPVVKLELGNYGYVSEELVVAAINELEYQMMMGEEASALQKLGIMLLLDSGGYKHEE